MRALALAACTLLAGRAAGAATTIDCSALPNRSPRVKRLARKLRDARTHPLLHVTSGWCANIDAMDAAWRPLTCLARGTGASSPPDAGTHPSAGAGPSGSINPQARLEPIDACTRYAGVEKTPVLPLRPLRRADGRLPPIP